MATAKPNLLLKRLLQEAAERPWLEFKENNVDPDVIGRTVSACANAAMLAEKHRAYIVLGIENKTKQRVGTTIRLVDLKKGGENLQNWLCRMIEASGN
jgi:predicted HTH transcriptional regulator